MIESVINKVAREIEFLAKNNITMMRAMDLLESCTQNLEELVAINTLRESYSELMETEKAIVAQKGISAGIVSSETSADHVICHA